MAWRQWLLVAGVAVVVCTFYLGGARSLTEHEIQVAGSARQMALDHQWLVPKIGDQPFLEKPLLPQWLVIASATLLGKFSETTARLPSALAGIGVVLVITWLALQWFGARVAIFTGLVQATSVYFITYARLCESDMNLAFIIVLALAVFVRCESIGYTATMPHRLLPMAFWALVGLSNLAKGLGFGPFLILVPCVSYLILRKDRAAWLRLVSWTGWGLALVLAFSWPILMARWYPEAVSLWREEIARRVQGAAGYQQPWYYYLTTVPWQLLPWTPALLLSAAASLTRAKGNARSADRFIWCWTITPIVLLSFCPGKHHHYIISCLCALSPLCALGLLRLGIQFATVCIAIVCAGILGVHAFVLSRFDRSRDDREFLLRVRPVIGADARLATIGGSEIARHIFYVDPPPVGIWFASNLEKRFHGTPFYVIARRRDEAALGSSGHVLLISESAHTRQEQNANDRFALFLVEPTTVTSGGNP